MDSFTEARNNPNTVNRDDGSKVYIKGPNKGMLIRPFQESELTKFTERGWHLLKDELTPSQSKIILIKKIGQTN
jgi:hypothetical protein